MKILWITNIVFPEAQAILCGDKGFNSSGGWMIGTANWLTKRENIKLVVATVSSKVKELTCLAGEHIIYYLIPYGKGNKKINHDYEVYWKEINETVKPDVVHLHGTEFTHGLAYLEACGSENVCVSIQGLLSAYNYYYYGLNIIKIICATTLGSLFRGGVLNGYRSYKRRSSFEKKELQSVKHIIGRTSWDKARTWAINPSAQYHHVGEILRNEFYDSSLKWSYDKCVPYSIFLSQSSYPIKGLHMLLRALPLIKKHCPLVSLRIAGRDIIHPKYIRDKIFYSDYDNIIRKMIKDYKINDCVTFIGPQDEKGMVREYLNCNVFVCPSSIENSSNSIGEAQILGTPVVASYVGGTPDMMFEDVNNLYRFEEIEMLAYKIVNIFDKKDTVNTTKMRIEAQNRHNIETIVQELIETYNDVIQSKSKLP